MFNRLAYLLALLLVSGILLVISSTSALACSTLTVLGEPTPKPDIPENRAVIAPIIFEGVVIEYHISSDYVATAIVKVYQYLKGIGPGVVSIYGFGNNMADCKETLNVGRHAIFYADGDLSTRLSANHFRAYSATDDPTLINIQRIIGVVGQKPVIVDEKATVSITPIVVVTPQPSPTVAQIVPPVHNTSPEINGILWFGAGLVVGGGIIAGLFLTVRRRKHA